jgi:hypothetical protein
MMISGRWLMVDSQPRGAGFDVEDRRKQTGCEFERWNLSILVRFIDVIGHKSNKSSEILLIKLSFL